MPFSRWTWWIMTAICIGPPAEMVVTGQEAGLPAVSESRLIGLPRDEYQVRRRELMKRLREARSDQTPSLGSSRRGRGDAESVVVLRGADDPGMEGRFHQSSDFAYLTGVEVPGAFLVLYPKTDRAVLYLPPADPHGGTFTMSQPGPGSGASRDFGFETVEPTSKLLADSFGALGDPLLPGWFGARSVVYLRGSATRDGAEGPESQLARLLRQGAPNTDFRDLEPLLASMRKVKSAREIELLKTAIAITGEALDDVARTLKPGVHEFTLQGAILGAFSRGAPSSRDFPP